MPIAEPSHRISPALPIVHVNVALEVELTAIVAIGCADSGTHVETPSLGTRLAVTLVIAALLPAALLRAIVTVTVEPTT